MKPVRIRSLFAASALFVACSAAFGADKPQVVILATGGTIAGAAARAANSATYPAARGPVVAPISSARRWLRRRRLPGIFAMYASCSDAKEKG